MWQEKGLLLIAKLLLPPQLRLVTPHIWREQQVQVRWKLLNVWIQVLALRTPHNIFIRHQVQPGFLLSLVLKSHLAE